MSIDDELIKDAKDKHINVSRAAEMGIMKRLNLNEMDEHAEYDEILATDDPEHYWIDLNTGKCKKRGNPQFFSTDENGSVFAISEDRFRVEHNMKGHGIDKDHIVRQEDV